MLSNATLQRSYKHIICTQLAGSVFRFLSPKQLALAKHVVFQYKVNVLDGLCCRFKTTTASLFGSNFVNAFKALIGHHINPVHAIRITKWHAVQQASNDRVRTLCSLPGSSTHTHHLSRSHSHNSHLQSSKSSESLLSLAVTCILPQSLPVPYLLL